MGASHSRSRNATTGSRQNSDVSQASTEPPLSLTSKYFSAPHVRHSKHAPLGSKQFDGEYKKSMHKAHDNAYKFNSSPQKKQTLERRRQVGMKYDQVAGIAKLHFQTLLEAGERRRAKGHPPDQATSESLEQAQSDWVYAHHLAESWGYLNPDNNPQTQYPSPA